MRTGSLFSGYDGLGLAVDELFPDNTREWFCEWDDAPSKILTHHWPTVPNFRDVTEVDWAAIPPVDILTGGYPCQPFSAAGQRKGTDDERHLWPYIREAIRHLRPRFTLLENVAGHRSLGFDRVLGDLAEDGMHVRWTSIRASDIGAPHHRERIFILVTDPSYADGHREWSRTESDERAEGAAYSNGVTVRLESVAESGCSGTSKPRRASADASNTDGIGCGQRAGQPSAGEPQEPADLSSVSSLPDANSEFRGAPQRQWAGPTKAESGWASGIPGRCGVLSTDAENDGRERTGPADGDRGVEWGSYGPAVRRWERLTRTAPAPTELNSNGRPRLNAAFAEWMMGLPPGHVTDCILPLTDPRPNQISRAQALKAIGNGVCPPQAVAAYSSLLAQAVAA